MCIIMYNVSCIFYNVYYHVYYRYTRSFVLMNGMTQELPVSVMSFLGATHLPCNVIIAILQRYLFNTYHITAYSEMKNDWPL